MAVTIEKSLESHPQNYYPERTSISILADVFVIVLSCISLTFPPDCSSFSSHSLRQITPGVPPVCQTLAQMLEAQAGTSGQTPRPQWA